MSERPVSSAIVRSFALPIEAMLPVVTTAVRGNERGLDSLAFTGHLAAAIKLWPQQPGGFDMVCEV